MTIPFDLQTFLIAAAVFTAAYVIFGITAFGAALFTVPVLTHFLPLEFVLPMCALIDMSAALAPAANRGRPAVSDRPVAARSCARARRAFLNLFSSAAEAGATLRPLHSLVGPFSATP